VKRKICVRGSRGTDRRRPETKVYTTGRSELQGKAMVESGPGKAPNPDHQRREEKRPEMRTVLGSVTVPPREEGGRVNSRNVSGAGRTLDTSGRRRSMLSGELLSVPNRFIDQGKSLRFP